MIRPSLLRLYELVRKRELEDIWLVRLLWSRYEASALRRWERMGRPLPPPAAYKRRLVAQYAQRFETKVLIETGTFFGDMLAANEGVFEKLISIELDDTLHRRAQRRFAQRPHITLLNGDSGLLLEPILESISEPCLLWLDAHYSGGVTARGATDTPIVAELQCILRNSIQSHVVLIDDARAFNGTNGYPTVRDIGEIAKGIRSNLSCEVAEDIIRLTPAES